MTPSWLSRVTTGVTERVTRRVSHVARNAFVTLYAWARATRRPRAAARLTQSSPVLASNKNNHLLLVHSSPAVTRKAVPL